LIIPPGNREVTLFPGVFSFGSAAVPSPGEKVGRRQAGRMWNAGGAVTIRESVASLLLTERYLRSLGCLYRYSLSPNHTRTPSGAPSHKGEDILFRLFKKEILAFICLLHYNKLNYYLLL